MDRTFRSLAADVPQEVWLRLSTCVEQLEDAWQSDAVPDWKAYLPAAELEHFAAFAAELIKVDQEFRWSCGEKPLIEDYLAECAPGVIDDRLTMDILQGELWTRISHGEQPDLEELGRRFPTVAEQTDFLSMIDEIGCQAAEHQSIAPLETDTLHAGVADTLIDEDRSAPDGIPFGRYILCDGVGRGAMGLVFRAYDRQLRRTVALKIPADDSWPHRQSSGRPVPEAAGDEATAERFLREARSLAAVKHRNICTVFDYGRVNGSPYLTMELLDGVSLDDWIAKHHPVNAWEAAEIVLRLAEAVQTLHSCDVVHRDIKSANVVMVSERGSKRGRTGRHGSETFSGLEPVLTDFGVAKQGISASNAFGNHLAGTPAFMAPEQAAGSPADARADVYSLGVVFFQLLTGDLPFQGDIPRVLEAIRREPPTPIRQLRQDIDDGLIRCCETAMAKDPAKRFQTAGEMAAELRGVIEQRRTRHSRLKRAGLVIAVAVAAVVAASIGQALAPTPASYESEDSENRTTFASGKKAVEPQFNSELSKGILQLRRGNLPPDPLAPGNTALRNGLLQYAELQCGHPESFEAMELLERVPWPNAGTRCKGYVWWNREMEAESVPLRVRPRRKLVVFGRIPDGQEADRIECWIDPPEQQVSLELWIATRSTGFLPKLQTVGAGGTVQRFRDSHSTHPEGCRHLVITGRVPENNRWFRFDVIHDRESRKDVSAEYMLVVNVQSSTTYQPPAVPAESLLDTIEKKVAEKDMTEFPNQQIEVWRRELLKIMQNPRPAPEVQRAANLLCDKLWGDRNDEKGVLAQYTTANERRTHTTFPVAPGQPILLFERLERGKGVKKSWNSMRVVTSHPGPLFVRLVSLSPDFAPMLKMEWEEADQQGNPRNRSNTSVAPYLHPSFDRIPPGLSGRHCVILRITANRELSRADRYAGVRRLPVGNYLLCIWQPPHR